MSALRVLSWNIGRVYPFGDRFPFAPLIPGIAQVLNAANADLIILHEVFGHPVARALHARLDGDYDRAMTWMPRSDRETLLFTPRGWTSEIFTAPTQHELMITYGEHDGALVRVAGVHACAYEAELRDRFFDALLTRLDDAVNPALEVIAGDFNIVHRHARGSDAALMTRLTDEEGFIDTDPSGEHTFLGVARLDYAFYRSTGLDITTHFQVLRGHLQPLQDHDPIVVELRW